MQKNSPLHLVENNTTCTQQPAMTSNPSISAESSHLQTEHRGFDSCQIRDEARGNHKDYSLLFTATRLAIALCQGQSRAVSRT
jgi:hypothetical protein